MKITICLAEKSFQELVATSPKLAGAALSEQEVPQPSKAKHFILSWKSFQAPLSTTKNSQGCVKRQKDIPTF